MLEHIYQPGEWPYQLQARASKRRLNALLTLPSCFIDSVAMDEILSTRSTRLPPHPSVHWLKLSEEKVMSSRKYSKPSTFRPSFQQWNAICQLQWPVSPARSPSHYIPRRLLIDTAITITTGKNTIIRRKTKVGRVDGDHQPPRAIFCGRRIDSQVQVNRSGRNWGHDRQRNNSSRHLWHLQLG